MRLHDDVIALRRELAEVRRRLATLERRDERRNAAKPEVVRALRELLKEAYWHFGVEPWEIEGNGRKRDVARARQWVMCEIRERHGFSFPDIADAMGRDHTTVISGRNEELLRRGNPLPQREDSVKIKAGRNAASTAPDPNRNRDTLEVRENGSH